MTTDETVQFGHRVKYHFQDDPQYVPVRGVCIGFMRGQVVIASTSDGRLADPKWCSVIGIDVAAAKDARKRYERRHPGDLDPLPETDD